jgi:hypothetical protein
MKTRRPIPPKYMSPSPLLACEIPEKEKSRPGKKLPVNWRDHFGPTVSRTNRLRLELRGAGWPTVAGHITTAIRLAPANFAMAVGGGPVGVPSLQADAYQREMMVLCRKVEQLCRDTWPKAKRHPSLTDCYGVAVWINVVKITPKPRKTPAPAALKHGRLLLRHLPMIQQAWKDAAQIYKMEIDGREIVIDQRAFDNCHSVLSLIRQTEQCVQSFLKSCTLARQMPPNPAAFIANKVQETWRAVPGATVPRSNKPNSPLCHFVTRALALAGKHFTLDTVSEMLRGRQRRPRTRKSRKKQ